MQPQKKKLVPTGIIVEFDNSKETMLDINLENFLNSIIEGTIILGKKSTTWNKKKAQKYIDSIKPNSYLHYTYVDRDGKAVDTYDVGDTLLCVIYDEI